MKCDRGSRVSCKERHTWYGVSRRPGSSGTLRHEGEPSASLSGLMESEVLDWQVAGTGSERCRGEPTVSPHTWPAGGERTDCSGGKTDASPNCRPRKNEDELFLHAKPRGVAVTVLSEESTFEAGRNAFAVWPRLVTVKRLSSFRPEGQERPGLAEVAGLLGRFRSTCLRGRWRGKDRPRAPQTVVGGGCVAWAPLPPQSVLPCSVRTPCRPPVSPALHSPSTRTRMQRALLRGGGCRCYQAFSTPHIRYVFLCTTLCFLYRISFTNGSVYRGYRFGFSARFGSATHFSLGKIPPRFDGVQLTVVNSASKASVLQLELSSSGSAQLFYSLRSQTSPLVHFLEDIRLVGLKDGHRMEGYACLTGRDVGLPDKSGSSPTRLRRKEGAGLPWRRQRGRKMGGQSVLYPRHGGVALLHRTHKVGEVSGRRVSKVGRKRLFPGSGDLLMQITEKRQLLPLRLGICTAKKPLVEFRRARLARLVGPIQRELLSGVRKHVHERRIGRWRPCLLTAKW